MWVGEAECGLQCSASSRGGIEDEDKDNESRTTCCDFQDFYLPTPLAGTDGLPSLSHPASARRRDQPKLNDIQGVQLPYIPTILYQHHLKTISYKTPRPPPVFSSHSSTSQPYQHPNHHQHPNPGNPQHDSASSSCYRSRISCLWR